MVNEVLMGVPEFTAKYLKKVTVYRRQSARANLLKWASSVVGLPLTDIKQIQNGAVFCYIMSAFGDLDVSHVQFLAVEEQEYSANYRLLQAASASTDMHGLNSRAKLRHWLRLAHSEADAWQFLAMLRIRLAGAARNKKTVTIEPDATPPPCPVPPQKGVKRGPSNFSTMLSSVNSTGQCWREVDFSTTTGSSDGFFYSPRMADTLSSKQLWQDSGVEAQDQGADVGKSTILDKYADNPSTQRARSCLLQMLAQKKPAAVAMKAHNEV